VFAAEGIDKLGGELACCIAEFFRGQDRDRSAGTAAPRRTATGWSSATTGTAERG
jgi:hypothetical protein